MSVRRCTNIAETRLSGRPRSSSVRTETGHMPTSGSVGSVDRSIRYWRRAPDTMASTTSLTLTPNAARTRLMSLRRTRAKATDRCGVMADDQGVRGRPEGNGADDGLGIAVPADQVARGAHRAAERAPAATPPAGPATAVRGRPSRRRWGCARPGRGRRGVVARVGPGARRRGGASAPVASVPVSSGGCGVRSNRWMNSSAPDTPSTAAWWILPISATLPSWRPSTTWISHSGRARSSGTPTMAPVRSVSSRGPPGAGRTWRRMW